MKKAAILGATLGFAFISMAGAVDAQPSPHSIYVDGAKVSVAAYEIADNNYFKLRDIAAVVSGSDKQFEVSWDGVAKTISLTSNKPYTTVGGELGAIAAGKQDARPSTAAVHKDGATARYTGYEISGNNFYKLRDVAQSFDIGIKWDGAAQRVDIITTVGYADGETAAAPDPTEPKEEPPYGYTESGRVINPTYTTDIPEPGQYTPEYQEILDNCGEEIITKTITYRIQYCDDPSSLTGYIVTEAASFRNNDDPYFGIMPIDQILASGFKPDSTGEGTFTLSMPKSVYEKTLNGNVFFHVTSKIRGGNKLGDHMFGCEISHYYVQDDPYRMTLDYV